MDSPIDRTFRDLHKERISRRELFRVLGLAALAVPAATLASPHIF